MQRDSARVSMDTDLEYNDSFSITVYMKIAQDLCSWNSKLCQVLPWFMITNACDVWIYIRKKSKVYRDRHNPYSTHSANPSICCAPWLHGFATKSYILL